MAVLPYSVTVLASAEFKPLAIQVPVLKYALVPDTALELTAEPVKFLIDVSTVADEYVVLIKYETYTDYRGLVLKLEEEISVG